MTAVLLREAAALMRERADLPWVTGEWESVGLGIRKVSHSPRVGHPWHARADAVLYDEAEAEALNHGIAEHIASWHPAVALAVADWLEQTARLREDGWLDMPAALAVATAYLGRES